MHGNSGLSDVADKNAVLSANLRLFLERRKDAIVIDDDVKIEDFVREYMQSHHLTMFCVSTTARPSLTSTRRGLPCLATCSRSMVCSSPLPEL